MWSNHVATVHHSSVCGEIMLLQYITVVCVIKLLEWACPHWGVARGGDLMGHLTDQQSSATGK